MSHFSRRKFLQQSALAGMGAFILPGCANTNGKMSRSNLVNGIQVWSVKEDMRKDAKGTLKALASYGYQSFESFENEGDFLWGMSPSEFKSFCQDNKITCKSSHTGIEENFERKAARAAEAGIEYLICPYKGPRKTLDEYKAIAKEFNAAGEICRKNGMRFAYHNHAYSFESLQGEIPQHVMIRESDPSLVDYEMDIYWVVTAGKSPLEEIKMFPGRYRLCHVKQRMKNTNSENASTTLNNGVIDYTTLVPELKKMGLNYRFVEQERFDNSTPLEDARINAQIFNTYR